MQVYDEYTAKIREALGRARRATSSRPSTRRAAKERIGDRPPNPELVTEMAR